MASQFKVPLKLTVDGENDLKTALSNCSKQMGLLSAEAKAVTAQYKNNKDSIVALIKQQKITSEEAKVQKQKLKDLKDAYKESKEATGEASDQTIKYKTQLEKAKASNADYKNAAKEATKELLTQNKAFQAAEKVASAFAKGGLALLKGTGKAAAASIAAVATGAVAMSKAIWDSASAASEAGDAIDKGSQKLGTDSKTYQELAYYADLSGTSMATLQKATQKLQAAGSDLSFDEALDQLYEIEDADERAAAAHEMFGDKIANELAPMLNAGAEGFEAAKQAAEDYGLVMSDSAVKASAAFNDTKTTMVDTVTSIKNNLSAELLPGINEVMEGITGLFSGDEGATKKIEEGIDTLMEDLDETIDKVSNILGRIIDAIAEAAPEIIPSLVDGILKNLDKLIDCAMQLIDALVDGLLTPENIDLIINGGVKLLMKLADSLLDNIDTIINATIEVVTSLCDALTDNRVLPRLAKGALDVVTKLGEALIDNAPDLIDSAVEMGAQLVQGLIDYDWASLAHKIYSSIKSAIIGIFKNGQDGGDSDSKSSNAGGLYSVPYDGYSATLHKGERVLTASEAQAEGNSTNYAMLNAKLDYLLQNQQNNNVNVNISGSAGAIVRALNIDIERENKRKSAFA